MGASQHDELPAELASAPVCSEGLADAGGVARRDGAGQGVRAAGTELATALLALTAARHTGAVDAGSVRTTVGIVCTRIGEEVAALPVETGIGATGLRFLARASLRHALAAAIRVAVASGVAAGAHVAAAAASAVCRIPRASAVAVTNVVVVAAAWIAVPTAHHLKVVRRGPAEVCPGATFAPLDRRVPIEALEAPVAHTKVTPTGHGHDFARDLALATALGLAPAVTAATE